jgi:hypothetical protein
MSEQDQSKAKIKIQQFIRSTAPKLIIQDLEEKEGVRGFVFVKDWGSHYQDLNNYLTNVERKNINKVADNKLESLAKDIVSEQKERYANKVISRGKSLDALSASISLENDITKQLGVVYTDTLFSNVKMQRKQHRGLLYSDLSNKLLLKIENEDNLGELRSFKAKYFLANEQKDIVLQKILASFDKKKHLLAPFSAMPAADYFNDIYGGDWEEAAKKDSDFVRPYLSSLGGYLGQIGTLMDGIANFGNVALGIPTGKTNFKQKIVAELRESSMIIPFFSVYLINYQFAYNKCIEPDALTFKKTTTSETVYRNGLGHFEHSVKHPDKIEYFLVNKRFEHIFKSVGLNKPQAEHANLLEMFFGNSINKKNSLSGIIKSTNKLMDSYDCNSPIIKKMEQQMLKYHKIYKGRVVKAINS